jgi:hypothetical protein
MTYSISTREQAFRPQRRRLIDGNSLEQKLPDASNAGLQAAVVRQEELLRAPAGT